MTLKVLPAEEWMHYPALVSLNLTQQQIKPICNRAGIYYNSAIHFSWFEAAGKAYVYDIGDFKQTLNRLNHKPLRSKVRDAIMVLQESKLASNEQLKLLQMDNLVLDLRELKINSMKFRGRYANRRNNNRSSA
jgi:hypothetical protein